MYPDRSQVIILTNKSIFKGQSSIRQRHLLKQAFAHAHQISVRLFEYRNQLC